MPVLRCVTCGDSRPCSHDACPLARGEGPCLVYVGIRGGQPYVGQSLVRCFGDRVRSHQREHGTFIVLRVWTCRTRARALRLERHMQGALGVERSVMERFWSGAGD
jgi:hypothetical protein